MTKKVNLKKLTEKELLCLQAAAIEELKQRGIVRTKNNPVGDYTEWLVSETLKLKLAKKSSAGYDATGRNSVRYEIKGRRVTPDNRSRQLSVIRDLDAKKFDVLIAVIFDANFDVIEAIRAPHAIVKQYANFRKHVNGHVLHVRGEFLQDPQVKTISALVTSK